jgi:hypothetical protein
MTNCPKCGYSLNDSDTSCPRCEKAAKHDLVRKDAGWSPVAYGLVGLVVGSIVGALGSGNLIGPLAILGTIVGEIVWMIRR